MRYLLDVNALVAMGALEHSLHTRVASWLRRLRMDGQHELLTCSITELGFVRVLSQTHQYGFTVALARTLLLRIKKSEQVRFTFYR